MTTADQLPQATYEVLCVDVKFACKERYAFRCSCATIGHVDRALCFNNQPPCLFAFGWPTCWKGRIQPEMCHHRWSWEVVALFSCKQDSVSVAPRLHGTGYLVIHHSLEASGSRGRGVLSSAHPKPQKKRTPTPPPPTPGHFFSPGLVRKGR